MRFPVPRLLVTLLLFCAVVPAVASADYDAEVLADQPTGYWRLDDKSGTVARNDIPGGTDGAYFGGPRLQSDGALLGSAAMMGGISSGLDLGPIPDGSRDFTVEAWSRQAGGGYYDMIFSRPGLWGVYSVDPGTSVICWGGRWPQGPSIHDDRWHLVTVRAKDGVLSLWIDGSLRTADTCPSLQGD